ncbi:ATP-binding protein [Actinokineospora guangxiensis]|uniref:ATP-binding protein n=1 Tax=Actinokineospora guangxiensis TaxID=1490288 RepID=A0ABW0EUF3_9PSEU
MGDGHDPAGRPSPEGVTTLDDLCARLRELRAWAGNPSFSRISDSVAAVRAARGLPEGDRPGRVTVYECFQPGRKRIDVDLLVDIVAALGADRDEQARWRGAHRITSAPKVPQPAAQAQQWWPPAELPADVVGFTGRERELAALAELLGEPGGARPVPVCVVSGIGGIGKTAVALRAAHDLVPRYPDGQLFADLSTAQPAEVLAQFLVGLGVDRSVVPDGLEERAALYRSRSAGRRVLVVLDNAPTEAAVRPLVPGAGTCGVLVTSRSRLPGLAGVHRVDVGGLPTAAALALLHEVAGGQSREWDDDDARAVVRLCDRMPLAIRIAGARLARRPDLRLARFAERLADRHARLDLLTSGDTGVRACFDLTCAELGAPALRVFLVTGLLGLDTVACWTAAVAAGMSLSEAELAIDELVDARLFTAVGTDPTGEPRFGMHDLIRLYAGERAAAELPGEQRRACVERATEAWLALALAADGALPFRTLPPPAEAPRALPAIPPGLLDEPVTWFEAERAQLRAAILRACRDGWAEQAWRLADACAGFYEARERYDDWDETHTACLAACPTGVGAFTMARNLAYRYSLPVVRGAAMAEHARRALAISEAAGLVRGSAEARVLIAVASINHGAFDEATGLAGAAREHAEPGGIVDLVALSVLGLVHRLRGDIDTAAERFADILARSRGRRHNAYELVALRTLAIIRRDQDRHAEAAAILADGLRLTRALGVRSSELLMLIELGEISALAGLPDADEHLAAALALAEAMSSEIGAALALRAMSTSDLLRGDPETALDRLIRSLAVQRRHGLPHVEAHTLRAVGTAQTRLGAHDIAADSWRQARAIYAALGNGAETAAIDRDLAALPVRNREAAAAEPGLASSP